MKIIASILLFVVTLTSSAGTEIMPVPTEEVRKVVCRETSKLEFPTAKNVLAIMWVESRFNPTAVNGKSKGLMQVNNGSLLPEKNIKQGIDMLRDLYSKLNSEEASLLAYNSGISAYKRGKINRRYLALIKEAEKNVQEPCFWRV